MDRIFFENIRCFATRQEARLAPLTVLVGENSSGKSTFLALVRMAWDLAHPPKTTDFNEEPFLLGAFDQLASHSRQKVLLGLQVDLPPRGKVGLCGEFERGVGLPLLVTWRLESPPFRFDARVFEDTWWFTVPGLSNEIRTSDMSLSWLGVLLSLAQEQGAEAELVDLDRRLEKLQEALGPRPLAFAPIRSKPQRTYDPIQGAESPDGAHIPMVLASIPIRTPEEAKPLFVALETFGRHSGLFEDVKVRHLGEVGSDPFQIQVQLGGRAMNLIDVGYGVSQVLPIVVDCLRGREGGTFLLQQPEVHLHPSAQAELGSFLGVLAKQQGKRFVIETHSDYLVDRIRMDIRDGKGLKPEDVSLLYFERNNGKAQIHALELDEHGNILDPPPGYRRFFLEEERRLLGG